MGRSRVGTPAAQAAPLRPTPAAVGARRAAGKDVGGGVTGEEGKKDVGEEKVGAEGGGAAEDKTLT